FQVLNRNPRPEWFQLARVLAKNIRGGLLGVHEPMRHSRVLRRKESGGSATNGFAISSVAFVRRSHWQVRRGRLSLAPDSCPENRRSNGDDHIGQPNSVLWCA